MTLLTSLRTCWRHRQLARNKLATSYEEVGDNLFVRGKNCWGIYRLWKFHTYRKFADKVYENIYFFLLLKMDDDEDDIIIAATCLFSPKISAILAHISSFSSSVSLQIAIPKY